MEDTLSYVIIVIILLLVIISTTIYAVRENIRANDILKQLSESKSTNVELQTTVDKLMKDNKVLDTSKLKLETEKEKVINSNIRMKKNVATIQEQNSILRDANNNLALNLRQHSQDINAIKTDERSLGLSYKSNNPTVYDIMNNIQDLLKTVQLSQCKLYSNEFKNEKDKFIQELIVQRDKTPNKQLSCVELDSNFDKMIKLFPGFIKNANASIKQDDIERMEMKMRNIYNSIRNAVCINNNVDITRLDILLTNIYESVCYSTNV